MKNICLIVLVSVSLFSCKNIDDCDGVLPNFPISYISVIDVNGNSLLGVDNQFDISQITLSNETESITIGEERIGNTSLILLDYGRMDSGVDYTLQLNESVSDILNLDFNIIDGECFDLKRISAFRVNGLEIESTQNVFTIVK